MRQVAGVSKGRSLNPIVISAATFAVIGRHSNRFLPSQSPGPFVNTGFNEPPRDDRTMGLSVGDVMQLATEGGLTGAEALEVVCAFP